MRDNPTVEEMLAANVMLPEVDVNREYWNPIPEDVELLSIENQLVRDTRQTAMFLAWRQAQQAENARRKALNEVARQESIWRSRTLKSAETRSTR